ncbi:MAG: hypothetical protein OXM56_07905, partial [Gammaproteobacteria bacterium]|nr:hypothetical protein [Gammaproteobacteria bacterium]
LGLLRKEHQRVFRGRLGYLKPNSPDLSATRVTFHVVAVVPRFRFVGATCRFSYPAEPTPAPDDKPCSAHGYAARVRSRRVSSPVAIKSASSDVLGNRERLIPYSPP